MIAAVFCVGGAFLTAYILRPKPEGSSVSVIEAARGKTWDQIIASLPPIKDGTDAAKARGVVLERLKTEHDKANNWVDLGDTLAQEFRDTTNSQFYDHAENCYRYALTLSPTHPGALTGMAWVMGGRHVFDQSIAWAKKALAADPAAREPWGIMGDAHVELGDYEAATEEYQKMMDLRPDLSSWSRGAHLLWLTGNKSKAMWLMERAIKAGAPYAENTAWCRAKLAMMQFNDGALSAAAQTLLPALTAGSSNPHLLLAAARVSTAQAQFDSAASFYQQLLRGGPNHEALVGLGDLHASKGEKEEAEKYYARVEALHAAHVTTGVHDHMTMARFYADHDRNPVEALRLAEQAKLTKNVQEADVLAWVYLKAGDLPHAIESMKRALKYNTPDAEMHYHAGMIAAAAGDRVSAQKHLQTALNYNPQFSLLQVPVALRKLEELGSMKTGTTGN